MQGYLKICPLTISWQQCDMLILKNVLIMIICVKVFCLSPVISINPVNSLAGVQHYMNFFLYSYQIVIVLHILNSFSLCLDQENSLK